MKFVFNCNGTPIELNPARWSIKRKYKKILYESVNGSEDAKIKGYNYVFALSYQNILLSEITLIKTLLYNISANNTVQITQVKTKSNVNTNIITSAKAVFFENDEVLLDEGEFVSVTPFEITFITKGIEND